MARRARTEAPVTEAPVEVTPDEVTTEAPVVEAPESTESAPVKVPAITTDNRDKILDAYRTGDKSMKAKIRKAVEAAVREAIMVKLDAVLAGQFMALQAELVATPARPTERIDPNKIIAERIVTLRRAADLLAGGLAPEGIDASDVDQVAIGVYMSELAEKDEMPDAIVSGATKIASAKITKSAERHDIGEWFARAFEGMAVGTELTVSQIITRGVIEGDPYRPTSGAVSARLNAPAGCTIPNVSRVEIGDRKVLGARRTA